MRWEDRRQSDNIEDERQQMLTSAEIGARIGLAGAGLALFKYGKVKWVFVIATILLLFSVIGFGAFPQAQQKFLRAIGSQPSQTLEQKAAARRRFEFTSVVLAETENVWEQIYREDNKPYREPALILYRTAIRSSCGPATTAIGPFYCPNDQTIYLDDDFFSQLANDLGAKGDFASAYVIAHEVGHHIQNLDGTLEKIDAERSHLDEKAANILNVRLELQADCYAGVWANHMQEQHIADEHDIENALNAAHKIGDDNLQKQAEGYIVPDSFTHGTSAQRIHWFEQGLKSGNPKSCNTITGEI